MNKAKTLTLLSLCSAGILPSCSKQAPKQTRPNIIFIMSDDHAYQALAPMGMD